MNRFCVEWDEWHTGYWMRQVSGSMSLAAAENLYRQKSIGITARTRNVRLCSVPNDADA